MRENQTVGHLGNVMMPRKKSVHALSLQKDLELHSTDDYLLNYFIMKD